MRIIVNLRRICVTNTKRSLHCYHCDKTPNRLYLYAAYNGEDLATMAYPDTAQGHLYCSLHCLSADEDTTP